MDPSGSLCQWDASECGLVMPGAICLEGWSFEQWVSVDFFWGGWGAKDLFQSYHQWFNKLYLCKETSIKTVDPKAQGSSLGTLMCQDGHVTWHHREGPWRLCIGPSQTLPSVLLIWLVLMCILHNKNYNRRYSEFLNSASLSSELSSLRRLWDPLNLYLVGGLGTPELVADRRWGPSCWGWCPLTCGVLGNSGRLVSELNCSTAGTSVSSFVR